MLYCTYTVKKYIYKYIHIYIYILTYIYIYNILSKTIICFTRKYTEKIVLDIIFTQKFLANFTNNCKEMASNLFYLQSLKNDFYSVCKMFNSNVMFNSMCFLAFHCKYLLKVFQKCKNSPFSNSKAPSEVSISLGLAQIEDFIKLDLLW